MFGGLFGLRRPLGSGLRITLPIALLIAAVIGGVAHLYLDRRFRVVGPQQARLGPAADDVMAAVVSCAVAMAAEHAVDHLLGPEFPVGLGGVDRASGGHKTDMAAKLDGPWCTVARMLGLRPVQQGTC